MAVHVIDTIKPKNNGTFPVVEAVDVKVTDSKRLDAALNDKANQSDLDTLSTTVSGKASQADLESLSTTVSGKASQSDLNALSVTVSGKASQSDLNDTNTAVASKASQADLNTLSATVSNKADKTALATTNATVETKANAADVADSVSNLQSQIDNIVTPVTQDAEVENARVGVDGTSYTTLKARLDAEIGGLQTDLAGIDEFKTLNVFDAEGQSTTSHDVEYTWNGNTCHCEGTATGNSACNFYANTSGFPAALKSDAENIIYADRTDSNIIVESYVYKNSEWVFDTTFTAKINYYTIPADAEGILLRVRVDQGDSVDGDVTVGILASKPNDTIDDELTAYKSEINSKIIAAKSASSYVSSNNITLADITTDGLYILSTSWTITDRPSDLIPTGLIVEKFSLSGTSFVRQTIFDHINASNKMYYRTSNGSGVFSDWVSYATENTAFEVGEVLASCDLNTLDKSKFYLLVDGNTYQHTPNGAAYGFLQTITLKIGWKVQIFYTLDVSEAYIRRAAGSNWNAWKVFGGSGGDTIKNYYSNTYNVTATPTIKTDTNNFLASTNDNTDRTNDIATLLTTTGACHLGTGVFWVKNLEMPANSILYGEGAATVVKLIGADEGYAVKLNNDCTIKDMLISGSDSAITVSSTVSDRHGILWEGRASDSGTSPLRATIDNVRIKGFSGGGITCNDTGYGTINCVNATNCYIYNCNAGINIEYWSEYHRFTNIHVNDCYYGCINNGGNNSFVNCGFSGNKLGMLMDNAQNQSPNNSHGSAIGCFFNHIDSNNGTGIKILNCPHGFMFSGCQMFYGAIELEDAMGIVFDSFDFGNPMNISIAGGGAVVFNNCMFGTNPNVTITSNQYVHCVNSYLRSGAAVTFE